MVEYIIKGIIELMSEELKNENVTGDRILSCICNICKRNRGRIGKVSWKVRRDKGWVGTNCVWGKMTHC